MAADNPFERYGLDPRDGIVAITQRLKELAEDATDPAERERIRAAWTEGADINSPGPQQAQKAQKDYLRARLAAL